MFRIERHRTEQTFANLNRNKMWANGKVRHSVMVQRHRNSGNLKVLVTDGPTESLGYVLESLVEMLYA